MSHLGGFAAREDADSKVELGTPPRRTAPLSRSQACLASGAFMPAERLYARRRRIQKCGCSWVRDAGSPAPPGSIIARKPVTCGRNDPGHLDLRVSSLASVAPSSNTAPLPHTEVESENVPNRTQPQDASAIGKSYCLFQSSIIMWTGMAVT